MSMQVSQVKLKRDTPAELFFTHHPLSGLILAVFGAGFGYIPTYLGVETFGRWIFGGMGALFVLIGILGAFWRFELRLDLATRSYSARRGFWPSPKRWMGPLDDLTGVILTQEWARSHSSRGGSTAHPWWKISLDFKGWEKPVSIEAIRSESKAHERLEYFTRRLKARAIDRTGATETSRNWDELDLPIAQRKLSEAAGNGDDVNPSIPPEKSGIGVTGHPGQWTVTLPPVGFNAGLVMFGLFGFVFAGFGILAKSGLYTELTGQVIKVQESSAAAGLFVAPLFVLVGFGISMIGLIGSFGRQQIVETGQDLVYRFRFLGWNLRRKLIVKREIEEIDLRGDISPRSTHTSQVRLGSYRVGTILPVQRPRSSEVFIRSDQAVIRLGTHLDEPNKQWLAAVLRQWAAAAK